MSEPNVNGPEGIVSGPYVYSIDGETWRGTNEDAEGWETREEALAAGRSAAGLIASLKEVEPGQVWTGVMVGYEASAFFPHADAIVEFMNESAEGEVGVDFADVWPEVTDDSDAGKELIEFVEKVMHPWLVLWAEKHGLKPEFWSVCDVAKHADDDGALEPT